MTESALLATPWALWPITALFTALACMALLRSRMAWRVGPPTNNPFHASGQKAVAGLAPVLVATVSSRVLLPHARETCILGAVLALAGLGAIDDRRPYTPLGKLVCQLPIFVFVTLSVPPFVEPAGIAERVAAHLLHGLFLIVATNALNVLDVADGLAPCAAALSLGAVAALLEARGDRAGALIAASFGGATVGFLGFNTAGAIVLGDSGSLALGGLLAIATPLAVPRSAETGPLAAALLLLVPLAEVAWLSLRRIAVGLPPWRPSPHHLAYCLVRRGLGTEQAVALLVGVHVPATVTALWIWGSRPSQPWIAASLCSTLASPWLGHAFRSGAKTPDRARPRRFEGGAS
jgi:UDP-N-acetylmuramyl pentapeptide phosphotransferase/UDP-N-acetylglucosamine-1-phosphate transferase